MKNLPWFVSKQIGRFISPDKIFRSQAPVFLPFYHVVSNSQLPHILNYPYRSEKQFTAELDYVLKYFKPVSLEYLLENPKTNEKVFHLSFDDGLRESAEIIAPILLRKGIPATFFVNPAFIDNQKLFHRYKASLVLNEFKTSPSADVEHLLRENGLNLRSILKTDYSQTDILDEAADLLELDFSAFLDEQQPYLSTVQVKKLHSDGFTIGGHSYKHREFWNISEKTQLKQVVKSMKWVKENIKPGIKAFSFPFTDYGVSAHLIKKLVDEQICDITFGTAGVKYDEVSTHFQRYPVEQQGDFINNLKAEFVYFKMRQKLGKATVKH